MNKYYACVQAKAMPYQFHKSCLFDTKREALRFVAKYIKASQKHQIVAYGSSWVEAQIYTKRISLSWGIYKSLNEKCVQHRKIRS